MGCCGACGGHDKTEQKQQNETQKQTHSNAETQSSAASVNQFTPEKIKEEKPSI